MAKRAQQGSGEERVTARSRPTMNFTSRMPSVVSSSTLSNPERTSYGYQDPGKSVAGDDRSGKPEKPSPPSYSKEDYGQSWSSQEWESGAAAHDRSGKPEKTSWDMMQQVAPHREEPLLDGNAHSVRYGEMIHDGSGKPEKLNHQEEANSDDFVMGSDAAELVNKVKDQVQNRQKRMSNVAESSEEHSIKWECSWVRRWMRRRSWERMSQLFKVSSRILKISRWSRCSMSPRSWWMTRKKFMVWTLQWEKDSWKRLSLIGDETVINLESTKVCLPRFCVVFWEDLSTSWFQRSLEKQIAGVQSVRSIRDIDGINGEATEFEWNIFPGFTTLQLYGKINDLLSDWGQTPETFTGRTIYVNVQWHLLWQKRQQRWMFGECRSLGQWSLIGPGSEKKCYSAENSPQWAWDHIADEMLLEFAESRHLTFRAATPLSRGIHKERRTWKTVDTLRCRWTNKWNNFSLNYHFCQSAQCLRSSGGYMWRIWGPSRWVGGTWDFDGPINCSRWK